MQILIGATSLRASYGGPALSVSRFAAALADAGCDVGLWVADQSDPQGAADTSLAKVLRLRTPLNGIFEVFTPHIVHDNGLWLRHHHTLAAVARARKIPRVVSTRGMLDPWALHHKSWKKRLAWMLYQRRDLSGAAALHATAQSEAEHLKAFGFEMPIWTIRNGMDLPILPPSAQKFERDRASTALFLGRLYPVKGLPMLIEAWARVRPSGWRLVIAGPDEAGHRRYLERAVAAANLNAVVRFVGELYGDEKTTALNNAKLFILPSYSESFGMAVAEALAYGVPVLTTTAAPWPMLESRGCGWCVEPTIEGIEVGLARATACTSDSLHAMGAAGRAVISEEFAWSRVAEDFVSHYSNVLRMSRLRPN